MLPKARPLITTSPDTTIMPLATAKIWLRRNGAMRRAMLRARARPGPETVPKGYVEPGVDIAPHARACPLEEAKSHGETDSSIKTAELSDQRDGAALSGMEQTVRFP